MRSTALKSQVSWLCLSDDEIKQARQIIASAGPESTVDVLGLGAPVESISDLLFPGTSTLHTELRYAIFVPAILYAIRENGGAVDPFGTLKRKEDELIKSLLRSGLKEGVIGRTRGIDLKYWPSTTYWAAVNTFKTLGADHYDRGLLLEKLTRTKHLDLVSDDGESTNGNNLPFLGNDRFLPIAKSLFSDFRKMSWPDKMNFKLTRVEARFISDQIQEYYPDSLYGELLQLSRAGLTATKTLFDVKNVRPELGRLILECGNYSKLSMGATYAYRWALCDHIASERKAEDLKAEWTAHKNRNAQLFKIWQDQNISLKGWTIENLTEAMVDAFPKSKRSFNPIEKTTEIFCDEICELIFAKGKAIASVRKQALKIKDSHSLGFPS